MASGRVLGIDLGTTNSVVAVADSAEARVLPDAEGHLLVPSVVSFHPSGQILVGRTARDRRLLDARNTIYSVKRLIGRPFRSPEVRRAQERFPFELKDGPTGGVLVMARAETYTLSEISAFVLREVRTVAEQALGEPCTRAVVTVPANFNELQRSATKAAGRVAGLDVLRILNEPTAAALAYGYGRGSRERVAVFDLGGGTFDMTILELSGDVFEVLATAGDTYLGGDDIDVLIADQMSEAFLHHHRYDARQDAQAYERLRAAAEWAKCQLSAEEEVQLRIEELAYGDGGVSLDLAFSLERATLERMAQPLIARAFDVCEDAMKVAALRPTQLDNVILVGGSTRMPLVKRMVSEYFGRAALTTIDPDLVVARGAAIQGAALTSAAERQALGRVNLKRMTEAELESARAAARQRSVQPELAEDEVTQIRGPAIQRPDLPLPEPQRPRVGTSPFGQPVPPQLPGGGPRQNVPPPVPSAVPPPVPPPVPTPATPLAATAAMPSIPAFPGYADAGSTSLDGAPPEMPDLPMPDLGAQQGLAPPNLTPPPDMSPPLLLDVTPHSLCIETVGGFCEVVIKRNATIPVEQAKTFTTAQDKQEVVRVRICQGESRKLVENQGLGEIELAGLRPAARGEVKIDVTFELGADGTLSVKARDVDTGREQSVSIKLVGGIGDQEIQQMQDRQRQLLSAQ